MQSKATRTERLNEYESSGSSFLTVNIIHFITFCSGKMWHPSSGQESAHSIGTRRKIDTTREWREQTSISSGLAWKKKRLGDLFGRIWHLECINNQLYFFFFWRNEMSVGVYECWGEMIQCRSPSVLRLLQQRLNAADLTFQPNYKS